MIYGFLQDQTVYKMPWFCCGRREEDIIDVPVDDIMIEVKPREGCIVEGCTSKKLSYSTTHKAIPIACYKHRVGYVKSEITCAGRACKKEPVYNWPGKYYGYVCKDHVLDGMYKIGGPKCIEDMCHKVPIYSKTRKDSPVYCRDHAPLDSYNASEYKCVDCDIPAKYGFPGQEPTSCKVHKVPGQVNNSLMRCSADECTAIATHGLYNPRRCFLHADKHDFDLVQRVCTSCGLTEVLSRDGLCRYCNPDAGIAVRKKKENMVERFLRENNIKYSAWDRTLPDGCGKERPDFLFDCLTHYVVLEVDEHQHNSRDYQGCEVIRMKNISQGLGLPTIFIRFNPDKYKVEGKKYDPPFSERKELLKSTLIKYIEPFQYSSEKMGFLSCIKLFYDDLDSSLVVITPYDQN